MDKHFYSEIDYNKVLLDYPELYHKSLSVTFDRLYLLELTLIGRFVKHKTYDNYFSIAKEVLSKIISYNTFIRNKGIEILFNIETKNCGFSDSNLTKAYKLRDKFSKIKFKEEYLLKEPIKYQRGKFKKKVFWQLDDKIYKTKNDLIKGEKLSNRQVTKLSKELKKEYIQMVTTSIDMELMSSFAKHSAKELSRYHHEVDMNFKEMEYLYNDMINTLSNYCFPDVVFFTNAYKQYEKGLRTTHYTRANSGRLISIAGVPDSFNLQNIPKKYRKYIFKGFYEYDINNSAPTLLLQYYTKKGGSTLEYLEKYLQDKELFRNALVKQGFTYAQAKRYLLAMTFGSRLDIDSDRYYDHKVWTKDIGMDIIYEAINNPLIRNLYEDFRTMFNFIGSYSKAKAKKDEKGNYIVWNKQGRSKLLKKWDTSKAVMHKYFGLESYILDIMKEKYQHDLLLFDAFISKTDYSTKEISEHILDKSGYQVTLSKEII